MSIYEWSLDTENNVLKAWSWAGDGLRVAKGEICNTLKNKGKFNK